MLDLDAPVTEKENWGLGLSADVVVLAVGVAFPAVFVLMVIWAAAKVLAFAVAAAVTLLLLSVVVLLFSSVVAHFLRGWWRQARDRMAETRFVPRMRAADRCLSAAEFSRIRDEGTVLVEDRSWMPRKRYRVWWTPERVQDLRQIPPNALHSSDETAFEAFEEFSNWCVDRYASEHAGTARLVWSWRGFSEPCPELPDSAIEFFNFRRTDR
jgi:membrane protein implicated in regulation of membrane protease activity